jgi:hypothetical protein
MGVTKWKYLQDFVSGDQSESNCVEKWCEPFPFEVVEFPLKRKAEDLSQSIEGSNEESVNEFPQHLPPFPAKHTYKKTRKCQSS